MFRTLGRLAWVAVGAFAVKAYDVYRESQRELARVSRPTASRRVHPRPVHRPRAIPR